MTVQQKQYLDEDTVQWIFNVTRNWNVLNAGREPPTLEEIRATTPMNEVQWMYPSVIGDLGQHGHFCECSACESLRASAVAGGAEDFGAIFSELHAKLRSLDRNDPSYDIKKAELKRWLNSAY